MSDVLPPEHGLAPHNMPSRPWTGDPLQNVMLLPEELIREILEDLAVVEVAEMARLPLGEFTWRPHLVDNATVSDFSERYSPIWAYCVSQAVSVEVISMHYGDWERIRGPQNVSWIIRNSLFYGPLSDHTESTHFEDSPFDTILRGETHIDGYNHEEPMCGEPGGAPCWCHGLHNLILKFDKTCPGLKALNRGQGGHVRYEMCPLTQELAAAHGINQRGLRHTFMYNGGDLLLKPLLQRDWTSCPCCESGRRGSPPFLLAKDAASYLERS